MRKNLNGQQKQGALAIVLCFFVLNLPGESILRGKSGFYSCAVSLFAIFEFDDGYAFYCVMLFV